MSSTPSSTESRLVDLICPAGGPKRYLTPPIESRGAFRAPATPSRPRAGGELIAISQVDRAGAQGVLVVAGANRTRGLRRGDAVVSWSARSEPAFLANPRPAAAS